MNYILLSIIKIQTNIWHSLSMWNIKKTGLSLEINIGYVEKLTTRFPKTNTL